MTNLSDTLAALSEAELEGGAEARPQFYAALSHAYRTGQLVPVPSVERVAEILADCRSLPLSAQFDDVAAEIIAAMKEGWDG